MTRKGTALVSFVLSRLVGAVMDCAVVGLAYVSAFALRFDFAEPSWGWRGVALSCVTVCAVHLAALFACGCYSLSWRHIKPSDIPRYMAATALAGAGLTLLRFVLPNLSWASIRPPYSITLITFVFATTGIIAARILWKLYFHSRRNDTRLLEREESQFDNSAAARFLIGKTVLVTGAGGSIGSEIVKQVAQAGAAKVLMVERCENALYEIDRRMKRLGGTHTVFAPLMVDAADERKMREILSAEKPQVVLHAAAYKHVPMVELNPEEGWRNNTGTTKSLASLAVEAKVERFVLISTDKAVNPVSVMGKTKRAAEEAVMALRGRGTLFCAVRFGNVFGSSGSVVPLFREQIAAKSALTVTHPEMRRYFMTVQEAVSLVLQAASRKEEAIFTLDMGKSVRILDLAEGLIRQAGYRPYIDIPIVFTGIRPGEKLFEELDVSEKSCYRTDMAKIYITKET